MVKLHLPLPHLIILPVFPLTGRVFGALSNHLYTASRPSRDAETTDQLAIVPAANSNEPHHPLLGRLLEIGGQSGRLAHGRMTLLGPPPLPFLPPT